MKKIGIVTFQYDNYGTRLQNYALLKVLQELGFSANSIVPDDGISSATRELAKRLSIMLLPAWGRSIRWRDAAMKKRHFNEFVDKYLNIERVPRKRLGELAAHYDYFIAGSDQVWNPSHISRYPKDAVLFFLRFCEHGKRISYAPSFGVKQIPEKLGNNYSNYISDFHSLSVREADGQKIVKGLTGITAPILVDPTLLVSASVWRAATAQFHKDYKRRKYVVLYFLSRQSDDKLREIYEYATKNNMEIITITGNGGTSGEYAITPAPDEFVSMISNAQAVFSDSFHACVFSVIFKTKFAVYRRSDVKQFSRIENLLNMFGVQAAEYDKMTNLKAGLSKENFEKASAALKNHQSEGREYLRKALS